MNSAFAPSVLPSLRPRCHAGAHLRLTSFHARPSSPPRPTTPLRRLSHLPLRMQTWSDPAVTKEYIDFLEGINQREPTVDCQSTIVGAGRIGSFLAEHGMNDLIITRGQSIPPDAPGPVYVCTRNDDLDEIITSCPEEKRSDLVFVQNGMMERFLRQRMVGDNTKANLYFAIDSIGADPVDGVTTTNPQVSTTVCGKWEDAFAQRLERTGLTCKVLKERDFRRTQMEKLIWICVFNLLGAVHGNISMGELVEFHQKEISEMVGELSGMIRFTLTVGMLANVDERLIAYSKRVSHFPTALKEWKWRNGFFYDFSQLALSNDLPDPTPMHTGYLEDGKKMGIIDW